MNLTAKQVDLGILTSLAVINPSSAAIAIRERKISEATFGTPGAAACFTAIRRLVDASDRVHVVRLAAVLKLEDQQAIGGINVLAHICDAAAADRLPSLPELLDFAWQRQRLAHAHDVIAAMVSAIGREDIEGAKSAARAFADEAGVPTSSVIGIAAVAETMRKQLRDRIAGTAPPAVLPTGITALDTMLGGGLPRTLTVIGAEGGRGKTGLAIKISQLMASRGVGNGILSLEDPPEDLFARIVAEQTGFALKSANPDTHPETVAEVDSALNWLATLPISTTRQGRQSMRRIIATMDEMRSRGAQCVWVDNSNEVVLAKHEERNVAMDETLAELREWAVRNQIPVVFVTHLNRDSKRVETERIRRSDFAHSVGFERIARLMLGVRRLETESGAAVMAIDCVKINEHRGGWSIGLHMNQGLPTTNVAQIPEPKK